MAPEDKEETKDSTPERGSLFRAEALARREEERGPGGVLRIAPRWATLGFYGLVAVLAGVLVAGSLIRIDREVTGITAATDDGEVVVLVPAALAPEVKSGSRVEWGGTTSEITDAETPVLTPDEIAERYRVEVAAPSVALETDSESTAVPGTARVLVEREPVIVALIPGLENLFGD